MKHGLISVLEKLKLRELTDYTVVMVSFSSQKGPLFVNR